MKQFPRRAGAPAAEPVTLMDALVHLREENDGGPNDAYISSLISTARQACEDRTERTLVHTAWLLQLDAFPAAIVLHQPPIASVQAVEYLDEAGALQLLDPADYVLDAASEPGHLLPAPGRTWPATQAGAVNAVRVHYTAGYGATADSVPMPLKQWILLAVGSMYNTRNADADQAQVRHGFVDGLISPYRMLGV
jgi:uncharacterized phiE125 gp8 family phage protein